MSNKDTNIARQASIESRAQTFWLKSPEGEELIVTNLKPWCRERGLDSSTFIKVAKGKISNSKGWLCRYFQDGQIVQPEIEHVPRTKNKLWTITAPDGTVYDDVTILKAFCQEHGLSYGAMKEIGEGKRTSTYKGWTLTAKTPDFSGVKTAYLEQKAAQEAIKAVTRVVETITGETRECIEFPNLRKAVGVCYVYKLTCLVNGKGYIGVSVDPAQRFGEHSRYAGTNVAITNAIKKHGAHKFDKQILLCGPDEYCFEMEDLCILAYNTNMKTGGHGYNQREGGLGTRAGTVFDQWVRDKISAGKMGKSNGPHTEETKEKIRLGNIGKNAGKKHTQEHNDKIGAKMKNRVYSEGTIKKMSEAGRQRYQREIENGLPPIKKR